MIKINNERVIYTEWVPAGKFVKVIISIVVLLIASLGIIFTAILPKQLVFIGIIIGSISLFIFLMYWNYRGLKINLTNNQLEIIYGVFSHKRIHLNKVVSCDIIKARFRIYGGVGVRFGLDGSWAYTTDFGDAVKLNFQYGRPFVFSTRNPQKICSLIDELCSKMKESSKDS